MNKYAVSLVTLVIATSAMGGAYAYSGATGRYDLVISGGRVMDPESGLDAIRNVGIRDGKIVAVSSAPLQGRRTIKAGGRVVAPGFIDLHSHGHNTQMGGRVEAFDGVTTAIEGEMGSLPIDMAYSKAAKEGRAINYGYTASWLQARMQVMAGAKPDGTLAGIQAALRTPGWADKEATPAQAQEIVAVVDKGLSEGGLGVGFLLGYAPATTRAEAHQISELAAKRNVPVFVHTRSTVSQAAGEQEAIDEAIATGAQWHIAHADIADRPGTQAKMETARAKGARISAETLAWMSGSTIISAEFLRPEALKKRGLPASMILYYGRPVASYEELAQLQKDDPGAYISTIRPPEASDLGNPKIRQAFADTFKLPGWTLATDSMPWTNTKGVEVPANTWPLPGDSWSHPRSAGSYTRVIQDYVVTWKLVDLMDVIRVGSLNPAKELEAVVPQMGAKGRIKVGADADIIVFDPSHVKVRATMLKPAAVSEGMDYVVVNGKVLIDNGRLQTGIQPGKPVRRNSPPV